MPQPDDSGVLANSTPPADEGMIESSGHGEGIEPVTAAGRGRCGYEWSGGMNDEWHACAEPAGHGEDVMHQCVCGTVQLPPAALPEPAAVSAEPVQDAAAGNTAPAGTPDGSAVLGRALLDGSNDLWVQTGVDAWQAPAADDSWPRAEIEETYGVVREVLLVSPEAGRVLEAAQRWLWLWENCGEVEGASAEGLSFAETLLAHSVVAMVGDRPAEPALEHDETTQRLTRFEASRPWNRPAEPAPEPNPQRELAPPTEPATEGPVSLAPDTELAGDGPGFDRERIQDIIRALDVPRAQLVVVQVQADTGDQLRALLAEASVSRERGVELKQVTVDLSRTEDALAEVTADRDRLERELQRVTAQREELRQNAIDNGHDAVHHRAELDRLRADHLLIPKAGIVGYRVRAGYVPGIVIPPNSVEMVVRGDLGQGDEGVEADRGDG